MNLGRTQPLPYPGDTRSQGISNHAMLVPALRVIFGFRCELQYIDFQNGFFCTCVHSTPRSARVGFGVGVGCTFLDGLFSYLAICSISWGGRRRDVRNDFCSWLYSVLHGHLATTLLKYPIYVKSCLVRCTVHHIILNGVLTCLLYSDIWR